MDYAVKKRRKAESTQDILTGREGNSSTTADHAGDSATATATATLVQTPALISQSSHGISRTTTAVAAAVVSTAAVTSKVEPSNSLAMLGGYSSEDD